MVRKEIETMFPGLYEKYATKYGVASVPLHKHNGADSPVLPATSLAPFTPLPATSGGVANTTVLDGTVMNNPQTANSPSQSGTFNSQSVYVSPIPIIYATQAGQEFNGGFAPVGTQVIFMNATNLPDEQATLWVRVGVNTTFNSASKSLDGDVPALDDYAIAASIPIGGISGTLSSAWTGATGTYTTSFSSGSREVSFTNGSTAISWSQPLTVAQTGTIEVSEASQLKMTTNWDGQTGWYECLFTKTTVPADYYERAYFTADSPFIQMQFGGVIDVDAAFTVSSASWFGVYLNRS